MARNNGVFVISLDLELNWGVRDKIALQDYAENLLGVRTAVPMLLDLFTRYGVHATWATVGMLFFDSRQALLNESPVLRPGYENSSYSSYDHINHVGENEQNDPYHFAPSLIRRIASSPNQEIGTHT